MHYFSFQIYKSPLTHAAVFMLVLYSLPHLLAEIITYTMELSVYI